MGLGSANLALTALGEDILENKLMFTRMSGCGQARAPDIPDSRLGDLSSRPQHQRLFQIAALLHRPLSFYLARFQSLVHAHFARKSC
jgi:hypothetical protein